VQPDQEVTIEINGAPAGTFRLPQTGFDKGRLMSFRAELRQGANAMKLEFTQWAKGYEDIGPTAIMITRFTWILTANSNNRFQPRMDPDAHG